MKAVLCFVLAAAVSANATDPGPSIGLPDEGLPPWEDLPLLEGELALQWDAERAAAQEAFLRREEQAWAEAEVERQREAGGGLRVEAGPILQAATEAGRLRSIPGSAVPAAEPEAPALAPEAFSLTGLYVIGRGSQVFSWTQPVTLDLRPDPQFSGFRLYWWALGSGRTNSVDLPKEAMKILISGVAGAEKPITYVFMTVLSTNGLESAESNRLLIPPEP